MGRPKSELILAKKCKHCLQHTSVKCKGQTFIKESTLIYCPSYMNYKTKIPDWTLKPIFPTKEYKKQNRIIKFKK